MAAQLYANAVTGADKPTPQASRAPVKRPADPWWPDYAIAAVVVAVVLARNNDGDRAREWCGAD